MFVMRGNLHTTVVSDFFEICQIINVRVLFLFYYRFYVVGAV